MACPKLRRPERALGTLDRSEKGPMAPPPELGGAPGSVADRVAAWPGVVASAHWHLNDTSRLDGVDFYVGDAELGHIHLDGSIHLATPPDVGRMLVSEGLARPFRHVRGWVEAVIVAGNETKAVALFRRNYDRLVDKRRPAG